MPNPFEINNNQELQEILDNVRDVFLSPNNLIKFIFVKKQEIEELIDTLRNYLTTTDLTNISDVKILDIRGHRIHNIQSFFSSIATGLRGISEDSTFEVTQYTREFDPLKFSEAIYANPNYKVGFAFFSALNQTIRDLVAYRNAEFSLSMPDIKDDSRITMEETINYYSELIGYGASMINVRTANLFRYYYSLFNTNPRQPIAITNTTDDMCIACPVKVNNTNVGPHCVKELVDSNEDLNIIGDLVINKLNYDILEDFFTKFPIDKTNFSFDVTDDERIHFGIDFLIKALRQHTTLYPIDLQTFGQTLIFWMTKKGIFRKQQDTIIKTLYANGIISQDEFDKLDIVSRNNYSIRHGGLKDETHKAIRFTPILNSDGNMIEVINVSIEQWTLFDEDLSLILDTTNSRHYH